MVTKLEPKRDTRTALLQEGIALMQERGYTATRIQDVLTRLGMPKGSFYHHFDSKETFAVEIIRFFAGEQSASLRQTLEDPNLSPLQRLRSYCEETKRSLALQHCRKGCLLGNLSQEMADQSETLRKELCSVLLGRRDIFATCIREGQRLGEITNERSAEALAEFLLDAWSGAIAQAKTIKRLEPLDTFTEVMFDKVLKP